MRSYSIKLLCTIALSFGLIGCAPTRPPVPPGEVPSADYVTAKDEAYGHEVLSELSEKFELDRDDNNINRVRDLVDRLADGGHVNQDPWHVHVLKDDTFKNAAATRGNFVFVWTGMLNTVQNDDELATILAHEMSHVLAKHTAEDPAEETSSILAGVAGSVASAVLSQQGLGPLADLGELLTRELVGAVLINPTAQDHELEADQIGLFLMADSGFDPQAAVDFWRRVQNDPDFSNDFLGFLSSHPSSTDRMHALERYLPQALERYNNSSAHTQNAKKAPSRNANSRPVKTTSSRKHDDFSSDRPKYEPPNEWQ